MKDKNIRTLMTIGVIAYTLMSIGIVIRLIGYPNQLPFYIAGLLFLILIFIPLKVSIEFKHLEGRLPKWSRLFFGILSVLLIVLAPMLIMEPNPPVIISFAAITILLFFNSVRIQRRQLMPINLMLFLAVLLSLLNAPIKPQTPNKLFDPVVLNPAYPDMDGPIVYLDEAHYNFHKLDGLYWGFGEVLRRDGYVTAASTELFTDASLRDKKILAIANALHPKNEKNWVNPTYSAFTEQEMIALEKWVREGGSLFLIADHMPTSGAAAPLAKRFGIEFINGFAMDTLNLDDWFVRSNGTLATNKITSGYRTGETVDSILTFTGQAFKIPPSATPILTFGKDYLQWEPERAWRFDGVTPYGVEGYAQGMYMRFGKGKVVAFGEAMMFTSQLGWGLSSNKLGLSDPKTKYNQQLLLNIIHWLDDDFDEANR